MCISKKPIEEIEDNIEKHLINLKERIKSKYKTIIQKEGMTRKCIARLQN